MHRLKALGYLLAFVTPALMPISVAMAREGMLPIDLAAWFPLFFLFVLLPLTDYAIGKDASNPDAVEAERLQLRRWYQVLTLACLPIQLALVYWSSVQFTELGFGPVGMIGWLLSQGVVSGILAINVAHELIHKSGKLEPFAGGLLLCTVNYFGFKIEHLRGHHVHVSTPEDASSAPLGSNVYPFVAQALLRNTRNAWRLEADRLRRSSLPLLHWRNEMLMWSLITLIMAVCLFFAVGPEALLFFFAQGLIAAITLEVINYVEHYGLERRRQADGRYERTTHLHSWNSNYLLTNLMLFQLQRHSDHHETAKRRYQALRHYDASPQLPGGYAAMFLLALVPPLWKRVIHPRVEKFQAQRCALS
jgi:alkane 1-monooxygenase